jgi:hypothetical protein
MVCDLWVAGGGGFGGFDDIDDDELLAMQAEAAMVRRTHSTCTHAHFDQPLSMQLLVQH